ncbi:MAG: NUDIX domain-containing protein, partial [Clostridiales bacterium]|nr:NUDIX domain-containing protein [Clostridiales bacterium]
MVEYWDLYDKNREKTGKTHRRGEPIENGAYHIVVNVWFVNSNEEVLLAKRHPKKELWGGLWECSASGSVLAGEDSLKGAIRETKEELSISLTETDLALIETIIRESDFRDTYLAKKDIDIKKLRFHPDEVVDAKWVTRQEYIDMCGQELLAPPVRDFWELYFNFTK